MKDRRVLGGIMLILAGVVMMLSMFNIISGLNFLMLVGAGFLVAYILGGRLLGLLIPGCIVSSIGVFTYVTDNGIISRNSGEFFLLFLACAFFAVLLIHTMWIKTEDFGAKYWPIFPGGGLTIAWVLAASRQYYIIQEIIKFAWPIALIIAGLVVLFKRKGNRRKEDVNTVGQPEQNFDDLK